MTLAEKVKTARKNLNWTQSDLAIRCGVTLRTIQRIEKGEVAPSAYTLGKLVDLLELPLDQPANPPSQQSKVGEFLKATFSKTNKTKLLMMISTPFLAYLAFSWFTAPLSVREGMEKRVTLSTIKCESETSCDFQLTVLDKEGKIQLQKTYGGTSYDKASAVLPISDGGYFLLGSTSSFGAGNYDILFIRTDEKGEVVWQKTYGGFFNEYGEKISLSDGALTIEGLQQKCTTANVSNDCYLEKWIFTVDTNGNLL
ncbi:MAG: helix-turn-helix domain-containing protein [Algoriphagus sp.]|nr:helix-turn-helix domain-containing protein [Algoriphagus sp.]